LTNKLTNKYLEPKDFKIGQVYIVPGYDKNVRYQITSISYEEKCVYITIYNHTCGLLIENIKYLFSTWKTMLCIQDSQYIDIYDDLEKALSA